MSQTVAVTKAVTSLIEVETQFNIRRTTRSNFFLEWQADFPPLTEAEQKTLNQMKSRYEYHRYYGPLAEGAVNLLLVSPLLELAGFYEPPFQIRAEESVALQVQLSDDILKGRIDFLVVQNQFWVVVIESKRSTSDLELAIPQTLTYMIAAAKRQANQASNSQTPLYGLITTGGFFCFLKLSGQGTLEYDISDAFALLSRQNQLFKVLQVLKHLAGTIVQTNRLETGG